MRDLDEPGALAAPLAVAEAIYGFGSRLRNSLYDKGIFKPKSAPCKVVCIGALTVGGVGKTPFVEIVAEKLRSRRTCILSRGYGTGAIAPIQIISDGVNITAPPPLSPDEPYMLARKLHGIPVVCAPNRIAGAREMVKRYDTEIIIMDDGYQHRSMGRDLNILLLSVNAPFGNGHLTPRGVLREHADGAKRADIIAFTATEFIPDEKFAELAVVARKHAGNDKPVILSRGEITGFTDVWRNREAPPSGPVYAFCGVAAPERFIRSLEDIGHMIAGRKFFPDHYHYSDADIKTIANEADNCGAEYIVTTEKDAVRLVDRSADFRMPLLSAVYNTRIVKGAKILDEALSRLYE